MGEISLKTVHEDLRAVKTLVIEMKEYMEDCFLTPEEEDAVEKARKEFEMGETISIEELEHKRRDV